MDLVEFEYNLHASRERDRPRQAKREVLVEVTVRFRAVADPIHCFNHEESDDSATPRLTVRDRMMAEPANRTKLRIERPAIRNLPHVIHRWSSSMGAKIQMPLATIGRRVARPEAIPPSGDLAYRRGFVTS